MGVSACISRVSEHHLHVAGDESGRGTVSSRVGGVTHAVGVGAAVGGEAPIVTNTRTHYSNTQSSLCF